MPVRKMARSPSIVGGAEAVGEAVQKIGGRASDALQDAGAAARETLADAVEDVRDQMAAIEDALEEMTVDHPKTMLGLALAAGFALGLIYRASRGRA